MEWKHYQLIRKFDGWKPAMILIKREKSSQLYERNLTNFLFFQIQPIAFASILLCGFLLVILFSPHRKHTHRMWINHMHEFICSWFDSPLVLKTHLTFCRRLHLFSLVFCSDSQFLQRIKIETIEQHLLCVMCCAVYLHKNRFFVWQPA